MKIIRRSLSVASLLLMAMLSRESAAQLGPIGGHYAGRASDTGFGGGVGGSGGYSASVPIDLPSARGGMPVPVSIVYTGHGFGAAGLGWDVPLSYLYINKTLAHRRPAYGADAEPRTEVTVSLAGRTIELMQKGLTYVARADAPGIVVRQDWEHGEWVLYDGNGLVYHFANSVSNRLWLLSAITGPGNARVELAYSPVVMSPEYIWTAIDLERVSYNYDGSAFKHEVKLTYDATPSAEPLAVNVTDGKPFVRKRKIVAVEVRSRGSAGSATELLSRYDLVYADDPDTGQKRLASVSVVGRDAAAGALPVAAYRYGSASTTDSSQHRSIRYVKAPQSIALPEEVDQTAIAKTVATSGTDGHRTLQALIDVTGDGRPDLVFQKDSNQYGLVVARNRPGGGGTPVLTDPGLTGTLNDATMESLYLDEYTSANYFGNTANMAPNYDDVLSQRQEVWRKLIDMNGDGRLDLVVANEKVSTWVIYYNEPANDHPWNTKWKRTEFSVVPWKSLLEHQGFDIGPFLPIERRHTGTSWEATICYSWNPNGGYHWGIELPYLCPEVPETDVRDYQAPKFDPPVTYTEWELKDFNGDGYPDFISNSSKVDHLPIRTLPVVDETFPFHDWARAPGRYKVTVGPVAGAENKVLVHLNDGGVNAPHYAIPFAVAEDSCGVGATVGNDLYRVCSDEACSNPAIEDRGNGRQTTICEIADVNGDGLADRVIRTDAWLGTGSGFTFMKVGVRAATDDEPWETYFVYSNHAYRDCPVPPQPPGGTTHHPTALSTVRDLNGDGFPDHVYYSSRSGDNGGWKVAFGTGAGFGPPRDIEGTFSITSEEDRCDGKLSKNIGGLYDLDGDGKPEYVKLNGNALDVYQLVGSGGPRALDAGRLVEIDNGHGARNSITYRSAKDNGSTPHQVPFSEVVVGSVETTGSGLGLVPSTTKYAYGGATMMFDPFSDGFRFPGYARSIELASKPTSKPNTVEGMATVTDTFQPTPVTGSEPLKDLFARHLRAGRTRDVSVLTGYFSDDPSALLTVDLGLDSRQTSSASYTYDAQAFDDATPTGLGLDCADVWNPYCDAPGSPGGYCVASSSMDICKTRGFMFGTSTYSWRGANFPSATERVVTMTRVTGVDELGRVTKVLAANDLMRADDDLCVETEYASPSTGLNRVLSAPSSRYVGECNADGVRLKTLAAEHWEYDNLPSGSVAEGRVTAHTVDRFDSQTGAPLGSIRKFDAQYDNLGNPNVVIRQREDGATQTATLAYDPFGLAVRSIRSEATGAAPRETTIELNPVTLETLSAKDPNGTVWGSTFDGFGRPELSTVTPAGGVPGALSLVSYEGFDGSTERTVTLKTFTDPVSPPENAVNAPGKTTKLFLDEVGRRRYAEVSLGADYGEQTLVIGMHTYDGLGRVSFVADPFLKGQSFQNAYGTTQHFHADGTPSCSIRGYGPQAFTNVTDLASERFATCVEHRFENNLEIVGHYQPDSLQPGSPQAGVGTFTTLTAIGRPLDRSKWRNGVRLDRMDFQHDRMGHQIGITRWGNPAGPGLPVQWTFRYDSIGQLLQLQELDSVPTINTFDNFGQLVEVVHPASSNPVSPERRQLLRYDGAGRLLHREERSNGTLDPETVADYSYDVGVSLSPDAPATHVLGRLAHASSPTGEVFFGYDGFGRVRARTFTDSAQGDLYIERREFHGDGSPTALELILPDTNHKTERFEYTYDSAGRPRSVVALGTTSETLYESQVIDVFGRVRSAKVGGATYSATFADTGRRLLQNAEVSSPLGLRQITLQGYDAVGRELSRVEKLGTAVLTTSLAYDELGRLFSSVTNNGTATQTQKSFTYDPLGNIVDMHDYLGGSGASITYQMGDRDRACRISYGNSTTNGPCNVEYDAQGRIVKQATRDGERNLGYFASGDVQTIRDQSGNTALFRYGALGGVQELDVQGPQLADARRDRRYGGMIERRDEIVEGIAKSFIARNIPTPGGTASKRGADGSWVFAVGEQRGNRFFVDSSGAFVQDVSYQPYGEPTSIGAQPGSKLYTSAQWNGGDALGAFNVSHLGARVYDPVIGRFLSRDPLLIPRSASTTNPYAFAANDPVNHSDPTGLDCLNGTGKECEGPYPGSWGAVGEIMNSAHRHGYRTRKLTGRNSTFWTVYNVNDPAPKGVHESIWEGLEDIGRVGLAVGEAGKTLLDDLIIYEDPGRALDHINDGCRHILDGVATTVFRPWDVVCPGGDCARGMTSLVASELMLGGGRAIAGREVEASMASGVRTVPVDEARRLSGGSARYVNPTYGTTNCANCAIAMDHTLAGRASSAMPGRATTMQEVAEYFGKTQAAWLETTGRWGLERVMEGWGPGSRGIVFGVRSVGDAHFFNVVNQHGIIRFIDAQVGGKANVSGFQHLFVLRTN